MKAIVLSFFIIFIPLLSIGLLVMGPYAMFYGMFFIVGAAKFIPLFFILINVFDGKKPDSKQRSLKSVLLLVNSIPLLIAILSFYKQCIFSFSPSCSGNMFVFVFVNSLITSMTIASIIGYVYWKFAQKGIWKINNSLSNAPVKHILILVSVVTIFITMWRSIAKIFGCSFDWITQSRGLYQYMHKSGCFHYALQNFHISTAVITNFIIAIFIGLFYAKFLRNTAHDEAGEMDESSPSLLRIMIIANIIPVAWFLPSNIKCLLLFRSDCLSRLYVVLAALLLTSFFGLIYWGFVRKKSESSHHLISTKLNKKKSTIITLSIIALIIVSPIIYWKIKYPSYTYRYRMTVEVETPKGIKSGSSVIEVHTYQYPGWVILSSVDVVSEKSVRGEGVFIEMEKGKTLFVLLGDVDGKISAKDFMAYAFPLPGVKVDEDNHPIGQKSDYGMTYPVYLSSGYGMKYYGTLKNAKGTLPYDNSSFESRVSKFCLNFDRGYNYLFATEPSYQKVLKGESISREEAIKLLLALKDGMIEIAKSKNKPNPFENINNINEEDLFVEIKKELIRDKNMISQRVYPVFGGGLEKIPVMVVVTEKDNDVEIEIVNHRNLDRIFGDGVKLKQIMIETTKDPLEWKIRDLPVYKKIKEHRKKLWDERKVKRDFSNNPILSLVFSVDT